jgi:hypothetical protein
MYSWLQGIRGSEQRYSQLKSNLKPVQQSPSSVVIRAQSNATVYSEPLIFRSGFFVFHVVFIAWMFVYELDQRLNNFDQNLQTISQLHVFRLRF